MSDEAQAAVQWLENLTDEEGARWFRTVFPHDGRIAELKRDHDAEVDGHCLICAGPRQLGTLEVILP